MKIKTPEGTLTIEDEQLVFTPADNGAVLEVQLDPVPDYDYQRGIYGQGSLIIGSHVLTLDNDQATAVIGELRRPRNAKAARKSETRADADTATTK